MSKTLLALLVVLGALFPTSALPVTTRGQFTQYVGKQRLWSPAEYTRAGLGSQRVEVYSGKELKYVFQLQDVHDILSLVQWLGPSRLLVGCTALQENQVVFFSEYMTSAGAGSESAMVHVTSAALWSLVLEQCKRVQRQLVRADSYEQLSG